MLRGAVDNQVGAGWNTGLQRCHRGEGAGYRRCVTGKEVPFRAGSKRDLSARTDRVDGEARTRRLGPPDARTVAVHHDLEVEQTATAVVAADGVSAPHHAAVVARHGHGQVLPRQVLERLE